MKKITLSIICCLGIMVSVALAQQTWNAQLVDFKVFLNGEEKTFNDEIVTINDKTYVPLREVSEMIGLQVEWDENNESIYLNESVEDNELYPFEQDDMWGYKDKDGNVVIEATYYWAEEFCEGLGLVSKSGGQDGQYGYIDETGKEIIPCKYYDAYSFSDGVALVSLATHTDESKFTYIDKQGNLLFEKTFEMANSFSEGYAVVLKEGSAAPQPSSVEEKKKWTYINKTGDFATEMTFDETSDFIDGYANVVLDGQRGKIDTQFNFYPEEQAEN